MEDGKKLSFALQRIHGFCHGRPLVIVGLAGVILADMDIES